MSRFQVWYMRPEFFRDGILGFKFLQSQAKLPRAAHLNATHVFLKEIEAADKNAAFSAMQAEVWSPRGEAQALLEAKGLTHTSMSVGDVLAFEGLTLMVDNRGWQVLK